MTPTLHEPYHDPRVIAELRRDPCRSDRVIADTIGGIVRQSVQITRRFLVRTGQIPDVKPAYRDTVRR